MSYADHPIRRLEDEWLNRKSSVGALSGLLADPGLESPLVVGVYGAWGSGKTSVMNLLRAEIERGLPGDGGLQPLSLWFDAWKYARQDLALWRALLLAVVAQLRARLPEDKEFDELEASLYRSQTITEQGDLKLNWKAALPFAADMGLRLATMSKIDLKGVVENLTGKEVSEAMALIEREQATRYREQVTSLEQFQNVLSKLVEKHIVNGGRRLYLFIDDLDRCLPEDAVGALEAIKLFLDLPGCIFVLGMDRNVVEQGIRVRYKEFEIAGGLQGPVDPRQYIDKIIQVPFRLPPLNDDQMRGFIETWCREHEGEGDERCPELDHVLTCAELIATGVAPNPRSVKRTIGVLRLTLQLRGGPAGAWGSEEDRKRLAKIVVLQTSYDEVYNKMVKRPASLKELEAHARDRHHGDTRIPGRSAGEGGERLEAMLALPPHFEPLNDGQLRELVYVTEMAA